jgi:O-antigen ligase
LLIGIMLGSFVLGLQSLYDIAFRPHQQGWGIYGPIIFGDLAVLFFSLLLLIFIFNRNYLINPPLLGIAVLFAILAGILSGSRNAWAAAIFSSLLVAFLGSRFIKIKYLVLAVISLVIVAVAILSAYKPLQERMILAYQQTYTFISEGAPRDIPLAGNSVGTRLEQWRSALQIYKDSPLFGFGGGNAAKEVNRFVKKGLAHPDLYNIDSETNIGGLHSTYFETLVNEGLIGLGIVLLFLCYPLYIFIKTRKRDPLLSSIGIIFISNYLVFGVSENPLVHDNFTSVYLLLLAVFFSTAIHSLHTAANTAKPRSDSTAKNSRHASTA